MATDIVGFSRLVGADEDRTLARLRAERIDLTAPTIAVHRGRIVKGIGDGVIVEFRSVVDAVRCSVELQGGLLERSPGVAPDRGDVVEEADGDLIGDGVNIASRLEGLAEPGGVCLSSAESALKNISRAVRAYAIRPGSDDAVQPRTAATPESFRPPRLSVVVLPFTNKGRRSGAGLFR